MDPETHEQGFADAPPHIPRIVPNILVTGVPGSGKTTLSTLLVETLNNKLRERFQTDTTFFRHINTGEIIKENKLWEGWDNKFDVSIIDQDKVVDFLEPLTAPGGAVVDFHTSDFFPERWFDIVVLLRINNTQLYDRLQERGYTQEKITENIECEVMDVTKEMVYDSYKPEIILEVENSKQEHMQQIIEKIFEGLKNLDLIGRIENKVAV